MFSSVFFIFFVSLQNQTTGRQSDGSSLAERFCEQPADTSGSGDPHALLWLLEHDRPGCALQLPRIACIWIPQLVPEATATLIHPPRGHGHCHGDRCWDLAGKCICASFCLFVCLLHRHMRKKLYAHGSKGLVRCDGLFLYYFSANSIWSNELLFLTLDYLECSLIFIYTPVTFITSLWPLSRPWSCGPSSQTMTTLTPSIELSTRSDCFEDCERTTSRNGPMAL